VKTISAIPGTDNTQNIQNAINFVGSLPKDANGIRGAVLLNAGKYDIYGTIYVKYDGVVLRGVGQSADTLTSTVIYARGNSPVQRDVVVLGYSSTQINGKTQLSGTLSNITDELVPEGAFSFSVENGSLYKVGDRIIIYHPCTQNWIDAVNQGGVPYPDPAAPTDPDERWIAGQLAISYNRFITSISGNKITVDAPIFYSLNKSISQCYCYKPNLTNLINQVGLENLRIDIETLGGDDENHAWEASRFKSCENSWAKNCTFIHFGHSGIITEACTRSTFVACSAIDPVAIITGERMYNFNTYVYSQLNLFTNCYARNGRHHYISNGTSSTSGNVFLRCISDSTNAVNEGHRQWTQGMLYDNHKEINLKRDFVLGLYNRVNMGTGHGWAAVHSVLWNCDVTSSYGKIALQQPPTGQNYAIGCMAKTITGNPYSVTNFPIGYVEGQNKTGLMPASIYEAQLAARKTITTNQLIPTENKTGFSSILSANSLYINLKNNSQQAHIQILSSQGKVVHDTVSSSDNLKINIANLPPAVYVINCRIENQFFHSKFIKL
jgi:Secretion system C-terminal sorting domain